MNQSEEIKSAEAKTTISPFEFAIKSIADPENIHKYREETSEEKGMRIRKDFEEIAANIKILPTPPKV
jgi:hypothetical protein